MGARKRNTSDSRKELKKSLIMAKLNNCPTSPRKMRLVADQVRGKDVNKALSILKFSQKQASLRLEKLLLSAINNWQQKNPDSDVENEKLYIKEIKVDGAGMLKRLRPAPQGRAHRIRKRSNHVTMILGNLNQNIN
ncbi:MAG: 50S ribosomal protein L22 [Flavobacteriaceae bacterium]|jgi:large subunit ribosomal protein L22|nr:50S ribosomal protein L22 [Flavobacteriaceae bacterium]MAV14144.1 50S ribosomal protein L22 [Flavobacteriaceae bacterium]RZP09812.1 MAG: 50S ribosomal protein L22 [Flavobacteriales bacterium]|tara:strand:+ start:255 stop:662 length:408 start_codon:yes stop_codon:yes gene_type:complete